jgi:hemolysin activation/secretion protein
MARYRERVITAIATVSLWSILGMAHGRAIAAPATGDKDFPNSCDWKPESEQPRKVDSPIKLPESPELSITISASQQLSLELSDDDQKSIHREYQKLQGKQISQADFQEYVRKRLQLALMNNGYVNSEIKDKDLNSAETQSGEWTMRFELQEGWVHQIVPLRVAQDPRTATVAIDIVGGRLTVDPEASSFRPRKTYQSESIKKYDFLNLMNKSEEQVKTILQGEGYSVNSSSSTSESSPTSESIYPSEIQLAILGRGNITIQYVNRALTMEYEPSRFSDKEDGLRNIKNKFRKVDEKNLKREFRSVTREILDLFKPSQPAEVDPISRISFTYEETKENFLPLSNAVKHFICQRIRRGLSQPLNTNSIEEQLKLLREVSIFSGVDGVLKRPETKQAATTSVGADNPVERCQISGQPAGQQSCLLVKVILAKPLSGDFFIDNSSPPSVGGLRLGTRFQYGSAGGLLPVGSILSVGYSNTTTGGNESLSFAYRVPLNAMDGTLTFQALPRNRNRITESPFDRLGFRGKSELYDISFRQPVIRRISNELAFTAGLTYQRGQTFLFDRLPQPFSFGADEAGVTQSTVLRFAQEYLARSPQRVFVARSQFNFGLGLFGATQNKGVIPDGQFFSWNGQVQWLQKWSSRHIMLTQAELQLSPQGLLASQQSAIGGSQSLRGYRQNVRSGDNSFSLSIENRFTLWDRDIARIWRDKKGFLPDEVRREFKSIFPEDLGCRSPAQDYSWYATPFIDAGGVWNNSENPNKIIGNRVFASVGLGLVVEARPLTNQRECQPSWSLRLDYGVPLIRAGDRGSDLQDNGFYFTFRTSF